MLAVKGTEGAGRRFRFAITPAAAAAAPEAASNALRTRGEVVLFLNAASGGAAAEAPSREASEPADSPRVCGRKRQPEETAEEPPAKRHESMPASPVAAESPDDDPLPPPADEPPSPPPSEPVVVEDAAPLPVAEAEPADKPFATAADECAALIGQRVCRGWRIMLPDGRSAQRWCVRAFERAC
jgi:hypothetical protein